MYFIIFDSLENPNTDYMEDWTLDQNLNPLRNREEERDQGLSIIAIAVLIVSQF
jgi:hypothetical protein